MRQISRPFHPLKPLQRSLSLSAQSLLTVICAFGLTGASASFPTKPEEMMLQVGVVQRFGEEATDQLILEPLEGDRLTLQYLGGNGQPQTQQVTSLKLEIIQQPLTRPILEERVVLGTFRSFEVAEDHAKKWIAQGLQVEIAQPERWEVWAKREVYKTPLLRRWLLQSLKSQGITAFLESEWLQQKPKVSWVINGFRASRDQIAIQSGKNRIQVKIGEKAKTSTLYGGRLRVQPNAYGSYTLVNDVDVETYLRGVVPHELDPGAPYGAAAAQAIIARTYALRNLRRFAIDNYQLCADTHCQVYRGLSGTTPTTDRAIADTKGQVLTYQNELVDGLYSSTTGGVTAEFDDVWNGPNRPYLVARVDAAANRWNLGRDNLAQEENFRRFMNLKDGFNETGRSTFRWRRQSTLSEMTEVLKRYLQRTRTPHQPFNSIRQLRVVERSPGGRVLKLAVQTDTGVIEIHKDDIRSAFYPPRSTLFYLDPIYDANKVLKGYAFVGGGFGHGVGMSQVGAFNLAKQGWTASQILDFYYPGTQLEPLQPSVVFWRSPQS